MPKKINSKEATLEVTRTKKLSETSSDETTVEKIKIRPFQTDTATVSVNRGATVKVGDYEFVRLDVNISIPCYREEIVDVFEDAKKFTEDKLNLLIDEVLSQAPDGTQPSESVIETPENASPEVIESQNISSDNNSENDENVDLDSIGETTDIDVEDLLNDFC